MIVICNKCEASAAKAKDCRCGNSVALIRAALEQSQPFYTTPA